MEKGQMMKSQNCPEVWARVRNKALLSTASQLAKEGQGNG